MFLSHNSDDQRSWTWCSLVQNDTFGLSTPPRRNDLEHPHIPCMILPRYNTTREYLLYTHGGKLPVVTTECYIINSTTGNTTRNINNRYSQRAVPSKVDILTLNSSVASSRIVLARFCWIASIMLQCGRAAVGRTAQPQCNVSVL